MLDEPAAVHVQQLPAVGASTGEARRFVRGVLEDLGLDHLVEAAVLAVSELVTNAVLHTRTAVDLAVSALGPGVHVEVGDLGDDLPVVRAYGSWATTGRGLGLVASVVDDFGVRRRDVGKVVWFDLTEDRSQESGPEDDVDVAALLDTWSLPDDLDEPLGATAAAGALASAELRGLPAALWQQLQQQADAALREIVLHRGRVLPPTPQAWTWYAAADRALVALVAAAERADLDRDGLLRIAVPVADGAADDVRALRTALEDADALALSGELLVDPSPPTVVRVRDWCCDEIVGQAGGAAPRPWTDAPLS